MATFQKGDSNRCRNAYEKVLHAQLARALLDPHKKNKHISVGRCRMLAVNHAVRRAAALDPARPPLGPPATRWPRGFVGRCRARATLADQPPDPPPPPPGPQVALPSYEELSAAGFDLDAVPRERWAVPDDCLRFVKKIAEEGLCTGPCRRCASVTSADRTPRCEPPPPAAATAAAEGTASRSRTIRQPARYANGDGVSVSNPSSGPHGAIAAAAAAAAAPATAASAAAAAAAAPAAAPGAEEGLPEAVSLAELAECVDDAYYGSRSRSRHRAVSHAFWRRSLAGSAV